MNNIVLIGLMGCGKSTLGRCLANALGRPFLDLDTYIEEQANETIPRLFSRCGEEHFRNLETKAARAVSKMDGLVIATGGGIVLRAENMEFLRTSGKIIFIDRPLADIISGIDVSRRPLLAGGAAHLKSIYESRIGLYKKYADILFLNNGSPEEAGSRLLQIIEGRENEKFAVVGDPIVHSLSPAIHLPVLTRYLNNPVYERVQVKKGGLPAWLERVKGENYRGFNLTMPHKTDIIPYLDELDGEARSAGSVNTVINRGGRLLGYSTDGAGFFSGLSESGKNPSGKSLLLFGAGGAARSIAFRALSEKIGRIVILARDPKSAANLGAQLTAVSSGIPVISGTLSSAVMERHCRDTDILVNTTPVGMAGSSDQWADFQFLKKLPPYAVVCDLIYKPEKTALLTQSESLGLAIQNGVPMLVFQALLADSLFLDHPLDLSGEAALAIGRFSKEIF